RRTPTCPSTSPLLTRSSTRSASSCRASATQGIVSLEPDSLPAPLAAFAVVFGVAFVISLILTPLTTRLGKRLGLVQEPGGRRKHKGAIPRIGGIPIYFAFIAAVLVSQLLVVDPLPGDASVPAGRTVLGVDPKETVRRTGLLIGSTLICLAGLYDAWRELGPLPQFIVQLLAAAIAIAFLIILEYANNPFTGQQTPDFPYVVTVTVTLLWLGMMMNKIGRASCRERGYGTVDGVE